LCMGIDKWTGLQCEGGNARCIASLHFGCHYCIRKSAAARALFTTER